MLLFIFSSELLSVTKYLFQYISCCYLSISEKQMQIRQHCFNTSHVVIYLIWAFYFDTVHQFQYISCCYLSNTYRKAILVSVEFQYISCCYLSILFQAFTEVWKSFNTSHVVIYQDCYFSFCQLLPRFNTSHVVIYPRRTDKV
mgnify:CR=1 FL=1